MLRRLGLRLVMVSALLVYHALGIDLVCCELGINLVCCVLGIDIMYCVVGDDIVYCVLGRWHQRGWEQRAP